MQSNYAETNQVSEAIDISFPWLPIPNEPAANSWWLTDVGIAFLGIAAVDLLVIAIGATMVLLFARSLIAEFQKLTNSLSAILQHFEKQRTPARASLAASVHAHMNVAYYQELIAAVEHAMLRNGFKFGQETENEVSLPLDVVRDLCKEFTKAQTKHMHSVDQDIEDRIKRDEETGYSEKYVRGIIAALREQGQFVERIKQDEMTD